MSKQFTITLEQRFQASANISGSWQLENNHELQIITDFIVTDNPTKIKLFS